MFWSQHAPRIQLSNECEKRTLDTATHRAVPRQTYRLQDNVACGHSDGDVVVQPERSVSIDEELLHLDGAERKIADGEDPHALLDRDASIVVFLVRLLANQALQPHNHALSEATGTSGRADARKLLPRSTLPHGR